LLDSLELETAERRDKLLEAVQANGIDVVQVCDTRLRESILRAQRDLARDIANARRHVGDGRLIPYPIGFVPGEQDDRPAADGSIQVRPPDLAAPHGQGSRVAAST